MAQEEHIQRYSNSSSGVAGAGAGAGAGRGGGGGGGNRSSSSSTKKQKQKRIPQRGLGVAQLEKIRLEEQQKNTRTITTTSPSPDPSIISPTNSSSSSMAVVHRPNFRPNLVIPPPPPSMPYESNTRPTSSSIPNLSLNVNMPAGKFMGFPAGEPMQPENWGFLNPPIWPTASVMQRPIQFQQSYSSSMVNNVFSFGTSSSPSSSSSGINYQMEPPSNQSYSGNIYPSTNWPEEEKVVVGMKRPYSFSIDNAPGPAFAPPLCPPPTFLSPLSRSDDSASCSRGIATSNTEPPNPVPRELPLISGGITERNPKRMMTGTGGLSGEFLTLGQSRPLNPGFRVMHPSSFISPHPPPEFGSLPYQGSVDDPIYGSGSSGLTQTPFINFLPPKETDNGKSGSNISSSSNGDKGGSVDTKLKL